MGEVWKQKKVKESSEKQEKYQKGRKSRRDVRPDVQTGREGGASVQREGIWALLGEEVERGWKSMKHRTGNATEVLRARGIQSRGWGDWRSSTKLCSYEHEDLLTDMFSFSAKAGPGGVSAKLRSCSLGVTWPLWIRPKVKLQRQ